MPVQNAKHVSPDRSTLNPPTKVLTTGVPIIEPNGLVLPLWRNIHQEVCDRRAVVRVTVTSIEAVHRRVVLADRHTRLVERRLDDAVVSTRKVEQELVANLRVDLLRPEYTRRVAVASAIICQVRAHCDHDRLGRGRSREGELGQRVV